MSGYNTRRKSLSLPMLGVALPRTRSPPSTSGDQQQSPPAKRVKRTHSTSSSNSARSSTSTPNSPPRPLTLRFDDRPKGSGRAAAHTPPPSPGGMAAQSKISTEGIADDIVVAVIEQLEKTGNRPHLLKELAAVLSPIIPVVERCVAATSCLTLMLTCDSSANPAAIISSRLATYLKRSSPSWTALSKCPLDKKLVGTHPKRIYYFLTNTPHQPIPADAGISPNTARIISPSLSSAASEEEEDLESRSRDRMSPSPELDLTAPEYRYDDGKEPFSNQAHPSTSANIANNQRAQSPPLEKEEKEFTQTATILQQRRKSQEAEAEREASSPTEQMPTPDVPMEDVIESCEETEECAALKNSEAAAALFGNIDHMSVFPTAFAPSSPALKPILAVDTSVPMFKLNEAKLGHDESEWNWSEMKSPENVELHELDDILREY